MSKYDEETNFIQEEIKVLKAVVFISGDIIEVISDIIESNLVKKTTLLLRRTEIEMVEAKEFISSETSVRAKSPS